MSLPGSDIVLRIIVALPTHNHRYSIFSCKAIKGDGNPPCTALDSQQRWLLPPKIPQYKRQTEQQMQKAQCTFLPPLLPARHAPDRHTAGTAREKQIRLPRYSQRKSLLPNTLIDKKVIRTNLQCSDWLLLYSWKHKFPSWKDNKQGWQRCQSGTCTSSVPSDH